MDVIERIKQGVTTVRDAELVQELVAAAQSMLGGLWSSSYQFVRLRDALQAIEQEDGDESDRGCES